MSDGPANEPPASDRAPSGAARGTFVVFEGPEGAGKSTQVALLAGRLRAEGRDVVTTREPGGSPVGDRIRAALLDPELTIDPLPEFLLFAAARAQHVRTRIAPALRAGATVLCDRFAASSVVYQGYGRGLDPAWLRDVNARATAGLVPDVTVLLDVPTDVGQQRVDGRGASDRLERADPGFHLRVRDGFLTEAARVPGWVVIDARGDAEAVAAAVWAAVAPRLAPAGWRAP